MIITFFCSCSALPLQSSGLWGTRTRPLRTSTMSQGATSPASKQFTMNVSRVAFGSSNIKIVFYGQEAPSGESTTTE